MVSSAHERENLCTGLFRSLITLLLGPSDALRAGVTFSKKEKLSHQMVVETKESLLQLRGLSLKEAAKICNRGSTSFKILCRKVGIERWPFRDVKSRREVQKTIHNLCDYFEAAGNYQVPITSGVPPLSGQVHADSFEAFAAQNLPINQNQMVDLRLQLFNTKG